MAGVTSTDASTGAPDDFLIHDNDEISFSAFACFLSTAMCGIENIAGIWSRKHGGALVDGKGSLFRIVACGLRLGNAASALDGGSMPLRCAGGCFGCVITAIALKFCSGGVLLLMISDCNMPATKAKVVRHS